MIFRHYSQLAERSHGKFALLGLGAVPAQVAIGQAWKAFDDQGNIVDEKPSQCLDGLAQSLYDNTCKLRGVD